MSVTGKYIEGIRGIRRGGMGSRLTARTRVSLTAVAAAGMALLFTGTAQATPLTEGSILPTYSVVSVGPNASVTVNSGPIAGPVLLGDGSSSSSSGGGNGAIPAGVFVSGTETGDDLVHIQTPPSVTTLPASVATQAFNDALALSQAAAALTPTLTYTGTVQNSLAINGNGGQEVIDFDNLQNPDITISGNASDSFVFNVSGTFQTNQAIVLNGVTASQILWNFTGTSGNVFQTSGRRRSGRHFFGDRWRQLPVFQS